MVGTRSGAAALLRGIAKAVEREAESSVCELTARTLTMLLADTLDAVDVLEQCSCETREVNDPCPVHEFTDAGL